VLPLVIQFLVPLRIYLSPFGMADVCWDVASEPASGSDKQKAPIISPLASGIKYFCFCASVPYS